MPNYYRLGNRTPANFTPRIADTVGPGAGLSLANAAPAVRAQIISSDLTDDTQILNTPTAGNPQHYSVLPNPNVGNNLLDWANTRAAILVDNMWDNPLIGIYTTDVNNARTGQVN
ncbi:hypothetical protein [Yersinia pekkanenii]|uniref:Uncharacterized protein n=1 Tax=Yersinia pekkanenii TaxID=1288385 RepID=A0A0T9NE32_9GAMM|nr:hypothetical protein [Yersinia pekkanenii]CNH01969.1 Uncharacterised protein [Yersinia pekkanenii]CRY64005.1 Uncharacterised protein [Yersinia pekkanenii]